MHLLEVHYNALELNDIHILPLGPSRCIQPEDLIHYKSLKQWIVFFAAAFLRKMIDE